MALAKNTLVTLEDYFKMRAESESRLEYIDGIVYMSPSPSTKHQRISSKLLIKIGNYLEGKKCEVFSAPYDIELKKEDVEGTRVVIPDLSVICDENGFTENKYIGVPSLIVEILSPSNQAHDLVTKLNLYMKYGVKEYWIVNPMLESITIYTLNEEGLYEQLDMKTSVGNVKSKVLNTFSLELESIFGN